MSDENEQLQHMARGEAAIRCAKDKLYRLADS
jgi:hypothetical protein